MRKITGEVATKNVRMRELPETEEGGVNMGKYSRDKGKRGELDVMHKLGGSAKRTGHSFQSAPDVITDFAAYSVKNRTIGGSLIAEELVKLEAERQNKNHYVVFKVKGKWLCAELLSQHVDDHGDVPVEDRP